MSQPVNRGPSPSKPSEPPYRVPLHILHRLSARAHTPRGRCRRLLSDVASNSRDHRVQQSAIALPKHWQSASHTLPRSQSPASTSGKPKSPIQRQFRCCVTAASKPMSLRRPSTAAHLQACGVQAVRAKAAVKAAANSVPRAADVGQRSVGQRSVGEGCVGQRPARQQVKGAAREEVVGRDARLREARRAGGVGARQPPCTLPPRPRALGAISRALGAISRTYLSSLAPSSPRQTRRETARASPERSQSWGSLARSR